MILPTISVIVPALNEEASIQACLQSIAGPDLDQMIVVDGGSHDRTRELARESGASVIEAPMGRASQMNAGAAAARSEVLLFLHADCTLAKGALRRLRLSLARGHHQVGYFRQRIDGAHPLYRLQELGSNLRARWLARPYGDQAMFFRREAFDQLGGFPKVPLMEDLHIARAARRFRPFLAMPNAVISSARRWQHDGILRRMARNLSVAVAEFRGQPTAVLLDWYEGQINHADDARERHLEDTALTTNGGAASSWIDRLLERVAAQDSPDRD